MGGKIFSQNKQVNDKRWRFCIAPMMKYTDRNYRFFARQISTQARLYTEMIVAPAITKGDRDRFLAHEAIETPVALQLGGSSPVELAEAASIGEQYGYDEINLNIGCPSDRVQSGEFGACLMAKPELVAECVDAIKQRVKVPVTIKTRIGIDDHDSYEFLRNFIETLVSANVDAVIIHARKAILSGLSPLQNRTIPPLIYPVVYQIKQEFPKTPIIINGGIGSIDECHTHLKHCDGVMLGRAACSQPYLLAEVDAAFYNSPNCPPTRDEVLRAYLTFLRTHWDKHPSRQMMIKPLYGLFQGQPGAKQWRRTLNDILQKKLAPDIENFVPNMRST